MDTEKFKEGFKPTEKDLDYYKGNRSFEYATPQDFFDRLDEEFNFTLNPCATKENAKCETFFTIKEDGLKQSWKGHRVFMNPPYGGVIKHWIKKAFDESHDPDTLVVGLLPARTDTRYFHDWIYHKAEIRFVKGRIKFNNMKTSPPFPSMIVIWSKTK